MDYDGLRQLVRSSENDRIEYKSTTAEIRGALESACAFLNERHRAHVIIGARNDGTIIGQQLAEDTRHKLAAELAKIEPVSSIHPEIVDIPNQDQKVIILTVLPAPELLPYTYDGRAFERIDNTTKRMAQAKYQRLLLQRVQHQIRWETGVVPAARLQELDVDLINDTVILGIKTGRIPETRFRGMGDVLDRLNLRTDGRITNAAMALFALDVFPRFPQFSVRLGRFRGTDKSEFKRGFRRV